MGIEVPVLTPFDPLRRRAEWELAAVLVALVVVPGAIRALSEGHGPSPTAPKDGPAVRGRAALRRARGIRPPRSY